MKKKSTLLTLIIMMCVSLSVNATEIWSGNKYVTWGQGLQIEASKFAASATPMELVVTFTGATDAIEFKEAKTWQQLYFDGPQAINGDGTVSKILTSAALDVLSKNGLEIIGANFTVTKVELNPTELSEGTLWKGFFWMDEWSTLPLRPDYFKNADFSKYNAIRFYHEAKRTDNLVINILVHWDNGGKLGDQSTMTLTNEYAELQLTDEIVAKLKSANELLVQCNKEGGEPFNLTGIELVGTTSGITTAVMNNNAKKVFKTVENGSIVIRSVKNAYSIGGAICK